MFTGTFDKYLTAVATADSTEDARLVYVDAWHTLGDIFDQTADEDEPLPSYLRAMPEYSSLAGALLVTGIQLGCALGEPNADGRVMAALDSCPALHLLEEVKP